MVLRDEERTESLARVDAVLSTESGFSGEDDARSSVVRDDVENWIEHLLIT